MPLNPLASWRFGRIRCHGGPFTLKRIFGSTSAMDFTSTATSHDNHLLDTNHSDQIDTEVYHMYHCMLGTCCAGYHCFDISGLKQSIRTFHARFCWDPAQDGGSLEDILPSDCRCCAVDAITSWMTGMLVRTCAIVVVATAVLATKRRKMRMTRDSHDEDGENDEDEDEEKECDCERACECTCPCDYKHCCWQDLENRDITERLGCRREDTDYIERVTGWFQGQNVDPEEHTSCHQQHTKARLEKYTERVNVVCSKPTI